MTDFSPEHMKMLNVENALSAHFKKTIIEILSRIAHDLVATEHAFERDFDKHYRNLTQTRLNLEQRDYEHWRGKLRRSFERGVELRNMQQADG
jgi:hypothetical protein